MKMEKLRKLHQPNLGPNKLISDEKDFGQSGND